ncbi:hypothetical protein SUDANB95_07967 (plasmid) [Actinosynnema sp. ALI-1.44]
MRSLGSLADFVDLDGRASLREVVVDEFPAHRTHYDLARLTTAYRDAINARLADTVNADAELRIDDHDDVVVDGNVDGDLRELLDDAVFAVDLRVLAEHHRRPDASEPGGT